MDRFVQTLLVATLLFGFSSLPAQTPTPPERPPTGGGEVERLREDVQKKQLELKQLRDAAALKADAQRLRKEIAEMSKAKLPDAEVNELRSVVIPSLRDELSKLREAKQLKQKAAALDRQLALERMSPEERSQAERRKAEKIADLRSSLEGAEARVAQEREKLQNLQAGIAAQRAKKRTSKTGSQLRRLEGEAKKCERALRKERKHAGRLLADLQAQELPVDDPLARARVTNREYQAALSLRPVWLPKLKYQDAQAVRAPDGHWWCIRSNDGYIEMRNFKEGVQGESTAHNWAGYYRRGGK